jgi:hypothetical protein
MSSDDSFINMMVEETFIGCDEMSDCAENNLVSLEQYFNQKKKIVSHDNTFKINRLGAFFRIEFSGRVLDIPSNWSIFKYFNHSSGELFLAKGDPDHLVETLSLFFGITFDEVYFEMFAGEFYLSLRDSKTIYGTKAA